MERLGIDWNTVVVSPKAGGLELRVDLDGTPSADWQESCNETAAEDALRREDWNWGLVRVTARTLIMQELDPDGRGHARAYLTGLVAKTNDVMSARLEEAERERVAAERREQELREQAEELAAWFRSSQAQDWAPSERRPSEAASDQDSLNEQESHDDQPDRRDLRSRLRHPFGAGGEDA
jgi:hypothetical protein